MAYRRYTRQWRRREWSLLALVIVGALALAPPPAEAQGTSAARVEEYIARNAELLEWAGELVAETESSQARRVLNQADDLHRRSQAQLASVRPAQSFGLARRARDAIRHATRLAREAAGLEERIRMRTDRFRDQHQQLLDRARDAGHERALDFLRRAERHALRAGEQYRQGDFQLSWQLLEQAEDLLRRAARFLADSVGPERLTRELERVEAMLVQARNRQGDESPNRAQELLAEAEAALRQARRAADRGESGRALQQAELARRMITRATARERPGLAPADVQDQIDRFDQLVARVSQRVQAADSPPAQRFLEQARSQRNQAGQSLDDGRFEMALRQIRAAHDQLNQAAEMIR